MHLIAQCIREVCSSVAFGGVRVILIGSGHARKCSTAVLRSDSVRISILIGASVAFVSMFVSDGRRMTTPLSALFFHAEEPEISYRVTGLKLPSRSFCGFAG